MSEDIGVELFDEYEDEVENENREENVPEAEEAPAEDQDSNKQPVKPKRVVRNPQPKLNAETLKGKRGLTALPSYFERVKYKGRGHEEEDLNVILKTYEYWCHRLFPKYPFDDCIAKIEKLGSKRAVVTHIKKIRYDMIYEDQPVLDNKDSDEEDNLIDSTFNDSDVNIPDVQTPIEITEEQQEQIRLNREKAEKIRRERLQRAEYSQKDENFSQASDINMSKAESKVELTEEQQKRIKENKERADRLRQEKLRKAELSLFNESSNLNESLSQLSNTQSSDTDLQNVHSCKDNLTSKEVQHYSKGQDNNSEKSNSFSSTAACDNEQTSDQVHVIQRTNLDELSEEQETPEVFSH